MNTLSRTITGLVFIFGGVVLIIILFIIYNFLSALIYGLGILIIGFFIFFNKNENKIESIKNERR